jgi:periplasmic protein CpxP/Spy
MNFPSLRLALLAGLALPFGLATASLAQDAPTTPAPAPGMHHDHHWGDHQPADPAERRARMAEHLSAALQLQPSQQAALAAFLDSMKPPGDVQDRMQHSGDEMAQMPTPERLDKMLAHFDAMRAHLVARADATKQFYAQLSASQQKAFDALAPMMMHRMGGHGMMGHHHDGDGAGHEMGPAGQPPG